MQVLAVLVCLCKSFRPAQLVLFTNLVHYHILTDVTIGSMMLDFCAGISFRGILILSFIPYPFKMVVFMCMAHIIQII